MKIIEKRCRICKKIIQGTAEVQVDYNMETHMRQKHNKTSVIK